MLSRGAAVVHWICLRLPSHARHIRLILNLNCDVEKTKRQKKRPGFAHLIKRNILSRIKRFQSSILVIGGVMAAQNVPSNTLSS